MYHVGYKQLRKLNLIWFIIITNNNNIYFNVPAKITSRSPSGYLAKYVVQMLSLSWLVYKSDRLKVGWAFEHLQLCR